MDRPRRDSRQHNGITVRDLSQPTFATKSANRRHPSNRQRNFADEPVFAPIKANFSLLLGNHLF
ncbi:hypothetical protein, partial [Bradyrhizobium sp. 44]|uniref:hypothetical protein n=1 Tax=Bradyrhizobium sp. 44 TaxID=2782675 RepID=UPI001FFBB0C8